MRSNRWDEILEFFFCGKILKGKEQKQCFLTTFKLRSLYKEYISNIWVILHMNQHTVSPLNHSVNWFRASCSEQTTLAILDHLLSCPCSLSIPSCLMLILKKQLSHLIEESSSMEDLPPQQRKHAFPYTPNCSELKVYTFSLCWDIC